MHIFEWSSINPPAQARMVLISKLPSTSNLWVKLIFSSMHHWSESYSNLYGRIFLMLMEVEPNPVQSGWELALMDSWN